MSCNIYFLLPNFYISEHFYNLSYLFCNISVYFLLYFLSFLSVVCLYCYKSILFYFSWSLLFYFYTLLFYFYFIFCIYLLPFASQLLLYPNLVPLIYLTLPGLVLPEVEVDLTLHFLVSSFQRWRLISGMFLQGTRSLRNSWGWSNTDFWILSTTSQFSQII